MSAPSDPPESHDSPESPASPGAAEPSDASASAETTAPDAPDVVTAESPEPTGDSSDDLADSDDPRMNREYVRTVSHPDGDVTLVGVVHDHPASVYRAGAVVRERDPEAVALELPPLAVPLYRAYAGDPRTPPSFGGEMSAAAKAARESDAEVVGVDGPTAGFFGRLARNCWRERASTETLRRVVSGVASVTRHAMVCRVAAGVAARTSLRVEVDGPVEHDCTPADPPSEQARDEREQARRSQSLLRTFDPPRPVRLRDETREEHMVEKLRSLRSQGDAVAIVGLDHLDAIAAQLKN